MSKKGKEKNSDFNVFDAAWINRNLPYVFFLIFLAMIYIANAHYTEKKVRSIDRLRSQIKELNWNYMSIKSDVIYQETYSELSENVSDSQLSNNGPFPKKISGKK